MRTIDAIKADMDKVAEQESCNLTQFGLKLMAIDALCAELEAAEAALKGAEDV